MASISSHFRKGRINTRLRLWDKAIESYKKSLKLDPYFKEAWFNLGYAYNNQGNSDEAIKALIQAILVKVDYTKAWNLLGAFFLKNHEQDYALISYKCAINLY